MCNASAAGYPSRTNVTSNDVLLAINGGGVEEEEIIINKIKIYYIFLKPIINKNLIIKI